MAYTLTNKCAKIFVNGQFYFNLLSIKNVVTCFFWNTVYLSFECDSVALVKYTAIVTIEGE